jgi:hypothetical protein
LAFELDVADFLYAAASSLRCLTWSLDAQLVIGLLRGDQTRKAAKFLHVRPNEAKIASVSVGFCWLNIHALKIVDDPGAFLTRAF